MSIATAAHLPSSARPWVRRLARAGFVARGLVYATVGTLAAQAAMGRGGRSTDLRGGIRELGRLQQWLLPVLAVGLASYAAWRAVQAILDTDRKGRNPKGLAVRAGYLGSAVLHAGLAATAARLAMGARDPSPGVRGWTARALATPGGRLAVAVVGAAVIAAAFYQLYVAWSARFTRHLDLGRLDAAQQRLVVRAGRAGYAARGVTFALIGWFLERAAWDSDARAAGGLGDALLVLQRQDHGPLLLGAVALGLVAYGALALVSARYRRIA